MPGAHYNLPARQQAFKRPGQGVTAERAAPHCRDSDRLADASTVRQWFWRLTRSPRFLAGAPTLFAWDWRAAGRIPIREANLTMMSPDRDVLQPRISLLDYLQQHGWKIVRGSGREKVAELCRPHRENRPSYPDR